MAEGWAFTNLPDTFEIPVPGCLQAYDGIADEYPAEEVLRNNIQVLSGLKKEIYVPYAGNKNILVEFGG